MFSFRGPLVLPALVAGILLTAVMFWQHRTDESRRENAAVPASATDTPAARPPTPSPAAARVGAPAPERAADVRAVHAAAQGASDPEQLPVQVVFKRRERLNKFEGRITNTSGDALVVEVSVSSANTHYTTQAEVSVGAFLQSRFGIDDGLDLQSGDQVTLRCYPYHDSVVQIP